MAIPKASQALARFTVLDLTRVRSGPTCVRQLADWGANVVKIEMPPDAAGGDAPGGPRDGSDFQNLHRNKRSMTLNLKSKEGRAAFLKMVKKADVIVENFRPDVKRRLKVDYKDVKKVNPRIVYGSISGFGQDGPYENRPGFDQIAQGMGGLMSITGLPGNGPVRVGIPVADLTAGLFCALGILTALLEREKSKKGQHISTSLLQAQIFMLDFQAARWLISIATTGGAIWERFCKAIGAEAMLKNPAYATAKARSENRKALNEEIGTYTQHKSSAEWIDIMNKAGVPCGPIYSIDQVFADPQVQHLGIAQSVKKRDKSTLNVVGQPFNMSRTRSRIAAPPPDMGQHTNEVLKEFGFSAKEIAALHQAKAV
jgi:crotonobetainyl-CoA:carnitine CoA-transferase CaiB-like acyl-CoA transferase